MMRARSPRRRCAKDRLSPLWIGVTAGAFARVHRLGLADSPPGGGLRVQLIRSSISSILFDVPEDDGVRHLQHIFEGHSGCRGLLPHAPRYVDHVLGGGDLVLARDFLALIDRFGESPLSAQFLDLWIAWPAKPCLVAPGRHRDLENRIGGRESVI